MLHSSLNPVLSLMHAWLAGSPFISPSPVRSLIYHLSSTTSIASSATLVSVATNIGGGSVFGGLAGLVFRAAQNPPIFDFDSKHPFRRFARVSLKMVDDLSCFPSLWQCSRDRMLSFELLTSYPGGTLLRPPGTFVGTYFCCSPSSLFL